jgi:type IV secretory pathway TrbL component
MIKLSQVATAQKPASSNMAAQALCEPAPNDATTLIANFMTGFLAAISKIKTGFGRLFKDSSP